MATYTEHYNLIKPALNDKVNINNLNDNADIIDTALNNKVNTDETQNITTSAANCMMSDGVTSVEGAIGDVTSGLTAITRNKYIDSTMSSQASVPANTDFMTHKLVIPESGTYLVMGGIFGIGVNLELVIREGESASGNVIANAWSNKCLFAVITRNANDVISFWMKADSNQIFYADGRGQKFFAIKLSQGGTQ